MMDKKMSHNSLNSKSSISYGPPKRPVFKSYSTKLESIENFKNKIILNEYIESITQHLETIETFSEINPAMIDLQPEVKWFMRPYLVNFIIQMHSSLKLKPQTLFLCWNIIDRYCAKRIAFKQHYQLIGCTSLWIAAKYEDKKSRVPSVTELTMMCSNVYEESMFREMEVHILSTLNWSISHTSLEDILQLAVKFADPDGKELLNKPIASYKGNSPTVSAILAVSRYFCELSLYDREYLNFPISLIAITSFLFSCSILGIDSGSKYLNSLFIDFEHSINNKKDFSKFSKNSKTFHLNNQLPTPITPIKNFEFFNEYDAANDDENYDSDIENKKPEDHPFGPFIAGFHGLETISQVRKISVLLLKSLLDPSEVLIEKYSQLGVISVVKNFIKDKKLLQIDIKDLNIDIVNPFNFELSNILLNFDDEFLFVLQEDSKFTHLYESPNNKSTTSSSSSFASPSNFSSFSSISSQATYDSCCYDDINKIDDINSHQFPNSSPILNTPN